MILEKAKLEEFEEYYAIKCEDFIICWTSANYEKPPRENLLKFYTKCVQTDESVQFRKDIYLIKTDEKKIIGYLYLDNREDVPEISIAISKEYNGKGYGRQAVNEGVRISKERGYKRIVARVREDNISSFKMFCEKCGFVKSGDYDVFHSEEQNKDIKMYTLYKDL